MKDGQKIIDKKYIKVKTLGSGGEGVAYLVIEKDTNLKLVAKIIEQKEKRKQTEYTEDEELEKKIEETKRMFYKIRSIESPFIIKCITEGEGEILKNNKLYKKRQYFIFEYAPKGDLWRIIEGSFSGFGERCGKILFKKILLGVQALHKAQIYHLDLKIDNIVIDDHYNPKICDFGFATDRKGKLTDTCGTREYKAPQKIKEVEYSGEKADIFSLGCILFKLVVGGKCFKYQADEKDGSYRYIFEKNEEKYFEILTAKYDIIKSLTGQFKNLFYRMIAYEEGDRPKDIEDILKDKWFDEINNLNDEKQKEIVKEMFDYKENIVDNNLKIYPHLFDRCGYSSSSNKGIVIEKDYFKPNLHLENKKIELNGDYYIKLLGKFNYCTFMNSFVNSIKKKYNELNEPCFINHNKENYKCYIEFQKDKEEEDNEGNENNKKDLKDLIIKLDLYRSGDEELILRFLRKSGYKHEYNEKILVFLSLARELNKKN